MKTILLFFSLFFCLIIKAQLPDSAFANTIIKNSDTSVVDSGNHILKKDSIHIVLKNYFSSDSFLYQKRLFYSFTNPVVYTVSEKPWQGKDAIFYGVIGLLFLFALLKNTFSHYFFDLFETYFKTTVRQRQVKDQLLQNPLPSLLFNTFFIISVGLFLSLLVQHFYPGVSYPFWKLSLYSAGALIVMYSLKFIVLKFFGWVFQMPEITDTYIFIVFSTNKILGVCLLPAIALLAFTTGSVSTATITLSIIGVIFLLVYRYFLSYISLSRTVEINVFHFILYLGAFEILPLLLINKLLFRFLSEIA